MSRPQRRSDWDASAYHRLSAPQFEWGRHVLERLELRGDETAIDLGCGTGRLTEQLLDHLPRGEVVGVDLSPRMLSTARGHLGAQFGLRATLVRADLVALPFERAFDLAFSTAAFHWVLDPARLYRGIFAALVPGGRLEAQCGGGPNVKRLHDRAAALMASPAYADHFVGWGQPWLFLDVATLERHLAAAGFANIHVDLIPMPTPFANAHDFADYVTTIVLADVLARLPDDATRERFMAEIVRLAAEDNPPYVLDYWRLNMSATRPAGADAR